MQPAAGGYYVVLGAEIVVLLLFGLYFGFQLLALCVILRRRGKPVHAASQKVDPQLLIF